MNLNKNSIILLFALLTISSYGQINFNSDSLFHTEPVDSTLIHQKKPFNAAGLILTSNLSVWGFDRFVTRDSFSLINYYTVKSNFKTGFVWDNDGFRTNLFLHPYHGGTYFNAARSNGMNFWQSIPFTASGSLMWEFFMENEPPAINDFFATTFGGTCLGEMNFRISDLVIDDRTRGLERFSREALLTVISPMRGLNRIISGEASKHRTIRGNTLPVIPITFYTTIGHRILSANTDIYDYNDVSNMLCFDLALLYGNPFDEDNENPFDFFTLKVGGDIFSKQPIISHVNALGLIFSSNLKLKNPNKQLMLGVFQHFNFYQSKAEYYSVILNPYKISEAASVGPGLLFKTKFGNDNCFSSSVHLGAILLGGSLTDHYKFANRDYNMGSGFSSKLNLELLFDNNFRLYFNSEHYRIYSWKGYDPSVTLTKSSNVQGDIGHATLTVASMNFNYILKKHYIFSTETSFYYRRSVYEYYPKVNHRCFENKVSLGYIF